MIKFDKKPFLRPDHEYTRRKDTKYIVVHCSDTPASWNGGAEEIREWHVNDNHWLDIGYHFVIRRDGTVEPGRPAWAVGSGVAGHNSSSLHVCLIGGRGKDKRAEDNFTKEQKDALALLLAMLRYYAYPRAEILGHRDFPNTRKQCPSFDVKPWWKQRAQLSHALAVAAGGFPLASKFIN